MGRFEGKVAIITGGARGQGRAHAQRLSAEGADIVIGDILDDIPTAVYKLATAEDLAETVSLVEANGARVQTMQLDVRDAARVDDLFDLAIDEFGRVDFVVANAGVGSECVPLSALTDAAWQDIVSINLTGVMNTMRAAARRMLDLKQGGRIIATASVAGKSAYEHTAAYTASKWGVIGLVKVAAQELGRHGITVNAVCPGTCNTKMIDNQSFYDLFRPDLAPGTATVEDMKAILSTMQAIPVPWVEPEDVAAAVAFLCSDDAHLISGVALDVAAGWSTRYPA